VTIGASLTWTLARSLALLVVFGWLIPPLATWVRGRPHRWGYLLAPFVFPELLVGYAYAPWVMGHPWLSELACSLLLGLRTLPAAVVAWELSPPGSVSASACYCRQLSLRTWADRWDCWRLRWEGPARRWIPAGGLFLLVTFQEFELAALLRTVSWTDWLFVRQATGMELAAALRSAALPATMELAGLLLVLTLVARSPESAVHPDDHSADSARGWVAAAVFLPAAWLLVIGAPLVPLAAELPGGLANLMGQRLRWLGLGKELAVGISAAACASAMAWFAAERLLRCGAFGRVAVVVLSVPGLLGSLILGLLLLALFQGRVFSSLYDTPVPWLLGLTWYLLPRAILLQIWITHGVSTALKLVELLRQSADFAQHRAGRRLWRAMVTRPRLLAVVVLAYWAYLELTLAHLLAPMGLTAGIVRLYNFMHYGRTAALSAEAAVLLLVPLLGTWGVWTLWGGRWRGRSSSGG